MGRFYYEIYPADNIFEPFRNDVVNVDWVKFQVYGANIILETFPEYIPTMSDIIGRIVIIN